MNFFDSKYFDLINFDEKIIKLTNFIGFDYAKSLYGYIIYNSFLHILSDTNDSEISGKMVLEENPWITVNEFLLKIQWGLNTKLKDLTFSLTQLFYVFVTQGYMDLRFENGQEKFNLVQEPKDYPTSIIEKLLKNHEYFIYAIDDLMPKLSLYIKLGKQFLDPGSSSISLLWESMHQDVLLNQYVKENIVWDNDQFSDMKKQNTITVANLTVGSGIDTRLIIDKLLETNDNVKIIIYCFDTSPVLLKRALDNLTMYKRQIGLKLHEKNIELQFHFSQISMGESVGLPESSVDLVIANYILHFISKDSLDNFFQQVGSLLNNNGLFLMSQIVSISNTVPHPITPLLLPFKNFYGIPTIKEVKENGKKYFKDVKETHLSTNWIFRKPRK